MLKIYGHSALSKFRVEKLLAEMRILEPTIASFSAVFVHFVGVERGLNQDELKRLMRLLKYGASGGSETVEGEAFLVVPRSGTISPWSSKATEIAQRCGLESIVRIERGVEYRIATENGRPL
ncbi:MAG: hypothetical protein ACU826_11905, partial [Gammaproteobacteria bacterium]